jgi:hypothetical protein
VTYGGDSGNRIFVLYWRCPLIRVSVIRGSTVITCTGRITHKYIDTDVYYAPHSNDLLPQPNKNIRTVQERMTTWQNRILHGRHAYDLDKSESINQRRTQS